MQPVSNPVLAALRQGYANLQARSEELGAFAKCKSHRGGGCNGGNIDAGAQCRLECCAVVAPVGGSAEEYIGVYASDGTLSA